MMTGFVISLLSRYYYGDLIEYNEVDGTRGTVRGGGRGVVLQDFDGKTGNRPLRKLKRWWDDNIKMDLK